MKEYLFNYYPEFKCIADKCKHSCCVGWEINIDSDSLERYKNEKSHFSKALICGINLKKSKFKTDKNKRCAFLNEKGLCELIINLGENNLCQVCRDHPRFRSFFADRIETGLGFCCEESARIILSFKDKIDLVLINDDKKDEQLDFISKSVLDFRKKAIDIAQDRTIGSNDRLKKIISICNANFDSFDFKKIIKTFLSFERLDKGWTKRLKTIRKASLTKFTDENLSLFFEQFLVNSLYRHLLNAEDSFSVRARTLACIFSWLIIKSIIETEKGKEYNFEDIVDVVRAYSSEIEYSQKNLDKLFNFANKFIKL